MKTQTITKWAICGCAAALMIACSDQSTDELQQIAPNDLDMSTSMAIPDSYIVVFNAQETGNIGAKYADNYAAAKQAVSSTARRMFEENGIADVNIFQSYAMTVNGVAANLTAAQAEALKADPRIDYIEQDQLITLAPPPGKGPGGGDDGGGSTGQETPYGITRVNGVSSYTGSGVAWILDSGIDLDHPDLNVDASRGFTAISGGRDGDSLDDFDGHGSHVAGTVAAINNEIGVIGVAPGATVIPVKVLNARGSGSYSGVIAGVDFVAANGSNGDVANMSLGGPVSQALDDAVVAAAAGGVKFVLAAGNESDDANNHSPARANGPNVYTISAMNSSDSWASFSNYGNPPVDYCAPGVSVYSTFKDGGYQTYSGTSMAAPHAAGVLLLGNARTDGTVSGDPDSSADPIIVH